ncbi:hypothetical protein ACQP00_35265 [Dactylosporangium sp. CS-047395]|uniref:hypothetical protein n=1 Tax=Dactylosporangium sp. CS-047395 TaxID=3239936 RepID=UPI003D8D5281
MPQHDDNGNQPVDALIDDLILDILNEANRGQPQSAPAMPQLPRMAKGTPLLERVLMAEAVAGALAEALAPALASALAPRILHLMEGEEPEPAKRTSARSAKSAK